MSNSVNKSEYNNKIKKILSNTEKANQYSKMFKKTYYNKMNNGTTITNSNTIKSISNNFEENNNNNNNEKQNLRKVTNEKSGKELLIKIKSNVKDRLEMNIIKKESEKKEILKKYPITRGLILSSSNKEKIKKLDENIEYYKNIINDAKKNINKTKKNINELNKYDTNSEINSIKSTYTINKIRENKEKLNNIQERKKIIRNEINNKEKEFHRLLDKSAFNIFAESKKSTLKKQIEELKKKLEELKKISNNNKESSKRRLYNLIHK